MSLDFKLADVDAHELDVTAYDQSLDMLYAREDMIIVDPTINSLELQGLKGNNLLRFLATNKNEEHNKPSSGNIILPENWLDE